MVCNDVDSRGRRTSAQGLIPFSGCSRFDVVEAYAVFADWWNKNGLTKRCHAKGRSISCQLHDMQYRPGMSGPSLESPDAQEIYLGLVAKYHPEDLAREQKEIDERYNE